MARRRYESTLQTVKDINITPLMDLTFLLLIVFMITAPMLEYEIDVSPPKWSTSTIEENDKVLMVNLSADGDIVFEREVVDRAELKRRLRYRSDLEHGLSVFIRADGDRPYREVMELMKAVKESNIDSVSLVTQPEE